MIPFFGPRQGRLWGQDTLHAKSPTKSIWPARGGPNGLDPATNNYPGGLDSWLICGPYDFTYAQFLQVHFKFWREFTDPDDFMGVVYSTNAASWDGVIYPGLNPLPSPQWVTQTLTFPTNPGASFEGQPQVWVGIVFRSDTDYYPHQGVWIDDLQIWRYNKPITTCGNLDPVNKGLHLPAYEVSGDPPGWYPFIRAGESDALTGTIQTQTRWVRLPVLQKDNYAVDQQAYDRMVDSFCNAGISVVGLINDETLARPPKDANDPTKAASYRQEFADQAKVLAGHFKGRVKYWQVWNEPYVAAPLSASNYAALLTQTSQAIKQVNPEAQVIAAGLEHAWNDLDVYFGQVYNALDNEQGHARPFDVFAIHPYPNDPKYGPDPAIYLKTLDHMRPEFGDRTIVDKFVRTMEVNGDAGKKVWATEFGWSSALGQPNAEPMAVDILTQAFYLQKGFDILFNEARSVDKVFWYKYWDENTPKSQAAFSRIMQGEDWRTRHTDINLLDSPNPLIIVPGWYGLYTTNRLVPKPSRCAFIFYPQRCPDLPWFNFLPLILNGQ